MKALMWHGIIGGVGPLWPDAHFLQVLQVLPLSCRRMCSSADCGITVEVRAKAWMATLAGAAFLLEGVHLDLVC